MLDTVLVICLARHVYKLVNSSYVLFKNTGKGILEFETTNAKITDYNKYATARLHIATSRYIYFANGNIVTIVKLCIVHCCLFLII